MQDRVAFLKDVTAPSEGEYLLVFKMTGKGSKGGYLFFKNFKMNGKGPLADAVIDAGGSSLAVGESRQASIQWNITEDSPYFGQETSAVFRSENPEIVEITADGMMTAKANGIANICASIAMAGFERELSVSVPVGSTKSRRSYYRDDKVAIARENIATYDWARSTKNTAVKNAGRYVDMTLDSLWELITTQELPRASTIGFKEDPKGYTCPACGTNLQAKYSSSPWIVDPFRQPWKIQCPECRRLFPSNDFQSFYRAGIDEKGNFNYTLAKEKGADYLKNILHPELGDENWCVDDGYGYVTGETYTKPNGEVVPETKTFIAYYNLNGLWNGQIPDMLAALRDAYLYTGEAQYGRVGAILVDRIADVYPEMDITPYPNFFVPDGGSGRGRIAGKILDYNLAVYFSQAYDAFWPAMEDSQVISYLSGKAEKTGAQNDKTSAELIRLNCDNGLLREFNKSIRDMRINSNFGHNQMVLGLAAVVLDTMPETKEWIDFCFKSGGSVSNYEFTGGNVYAQLLDTIDRDGHGNESAPSYNVGWVSALNAFAEILEGYDGYPEADLYNHPRFLRMMSSMMELTLCSRYTPNIADCGIFGNAYLVDQVSNLIKFYDITRDPNLARQAYIKNGKKTSGLHSSIYTKNPEQITQDIERILMESTSLDLGSQMYTGYGFAALRDGIWIEGANSSQSIDSQRDFWMYFGITSSSHSHLDKLNLGVHAFGLDLAPDLGQPAEKSSNLNRQEWIRPTLSHNTVLVNQKQQNGTRDAKPRHFDDAGKVKLMDVDAPEVYNETSIYRRTVVMVEASDDVSYGVDFFRIRGGNDHVYSFHAQSHEAEVEGVELTPQVNEDGEYTGSYAGADVPWGENTGNNPVGYSWLRNVDRGAAPQGGSYSVDFIITDYHKILPDVNDVHLRLTMLGAEKLSEVALADGQPPQVSGNPENIKYLLARRSGSNLDTMFTSIIEPYRNERYLSEIQQAAVEVIDGAPGAEDVVFAVKVTHTNEREDYIVYASNNQITYRIADLFDFRGFVGVYSLMNGEENFTYLCDGEQIGEKSGYTAALTGEVLDFEKELKTENFILISADTETDPAELTGRYIDIQNDGVKNAVYRIESAAAADGGIRLELGNTSLIRGYLNAQELDAGYQYNIAQGQSFRIPLSTVQDMAPVFEPVNITRVTAGRKSSFQVRAVQPRWGFQSPMKR